MLQILVMAYSLDAPLMINDDGAILYDINLEGNYEKGGVNLLLSE